MAITAANVLTEVREYLADKNQGQERWTDAVLLRYLSDALANSYKIRRDIFLASDTISEPSAVTATTDTVEMDDEYRYALAYYVCWKALSVDNIDKGNLASAQHYEKLYKDRMNV